MHARSPGMSCSRRPNYWAEVAEGAYWALEPKLSALVVCHTHNFLSLSLWNASQETVTPQSLRLTFNFQPNSAHPGHKNTISNSQQGPYLGTQNWISSRNSYLSISHSKIQTAIQFPTPSTHKNQLDFTSGAITSEPKFKILLDPNL